MSTPRTPQIWDGTCTWAEGITPFAFYDNDLEFQVDAVKFSKFAAYRLGYPMMDVELQSGSFFTCFEEAVTTYGNQVYEYKVRENYLSMEGGTTEVPANNMVVEPSLQRLVEIAKNYGTEANVGGNITMYHGMLPLKEGVQEYDLNVWAREQGVIGGIEIRRIFYEAPPAILRYFDPYAGTGTGIQSLMDAFDFGSYSPGVNFLLMPVSADLLKIQGIEFNDQVRKSAYTFECVNNILKIFPIPVRDGALRIEYYRLSDKRRLNTNVKNISTVSNHKMSVNVTVEDEPVTQTFQHNLGTTEVTVQAFEVVNGSPRVFIPADITILDENTISVTFNETTKGYLVIGYPKDFVQYGPDGDVIKHNMDFSVEVYGNQNTADKLFVHNLNTENIRVTVYQDEEDGTSHEIIPASIQIPDSNSVRISFWESVPYGHIVITYPEYEKPNTGSGDTIITNITEVPYENPVYSKINSIGRQWIFRYALALAKEVLAYVRGKYTTLPIPDSEATLNQADLLADARAEKDKLIEQLRDMLEQTSRQNQLERKAQETEYLGKTLGGVPMLVYVG